MELAKVTVRGQITIPIEIRRKLNIKDGDKVVFIEENGKIIMENSAILALREVQDAFKGEAERMGLQNDQDVVDMVKKVRKEMWEERYADDEEMISHETACKTGGLGSPIRA
jgi:antitoxin PrlF